MENLYSKIIKKPLLKCLSSLKKDFSFYNKYTELLAIWAVLFIAITGLFILAIRSNILIMFLIFIIAVAIMLIGVFAAAYYLHALECHNKKKLLPKIHCLLNKSFKLRVLFNYIKIPHISILNNITKNIRFAS